MSKKPIILKKREDHYSLFQIPGVGDAVYLDVTIDLIEFPDILIVSGPLEEDAQLFDLEDGMILELLTIPGRYAPHRYGQGTRLFVFEEISIMRKLVRPMLDDHKKLEICMVLRASIVVL